MLLDATDFPDLVIHAEICEDVWVPIPPSTRAALAGATVLLNLSAQQCDRRQIRLSPDALRRPFGALPCRLSLFGGGAGRIDDRSRLGRRGADLREWARCSPRRRAFPRSRNLSSPISTIGRLAAERLRQGTVRRLRRHGAGRDAIPSHRLRTACTATRRSRPAARGPRFPFVPDDEARLAELCFEAFNIQSHGLRTTIARVEDRKDRDRRLRRARLDAGAARRGDGDGRARSAARKYSRLYAAGLRDDANAPRPTPGR